MTDGFAAIVVTFYPDERLYENLEIISSMFSEILIIDNTPTADGMVRRDRLRINTTLISLGHNYGVGYATNIGILLLRHDICWVTLFDQDTVVTSDFIYNVLLCIDSHVSVDVVAPHYDAHQINDAHIDEGVSMYSSVDTVIASGATIKRSVFSSVGLMCQEFFIDYVDTDFFLRVKAWGGTIVKSTGIRMSHTQGNFILRRKFSFDIYSSNHNRSRRYYISRNRIHMLKLHYKKFPKWCVIELARIPWEIFKIALLEREKLVKVCYIARGIYEGVLGKLGAITDD